MYIWRGIIAVAVSFLFFIVMPGCLGPLDILGKETIVSEKHSLDKDSKPEDDRIEDKNPVYDPELTVTERFGECEVTLNKSGTVTKLDIVPFEGGETELDGILFSGRAEAIATVDGITGSDLIPSMEVINGAMKPFNDGFYAAIEMGLQDGIDDLLHGKRQFLYDLLAVVQGHLPDATFAQHEHLENALVFVAGGLLSGGNAVDLPADLKARAQAEANEFLVKERFSRPVGFYTWNDCLEEVFRQDRFLQNLETGNTLEEFGRLAALAVVLEEDTELLDRYQTILAVYAGLTNPYASYTPLSIIPYVDGLTSLDDLEATHQEFNSENPEPFICTQSYYALFPSSRSKDTEYVNSRWCAASFPDGVNIIDEFIKAIRSNEVDLEPDPDSGWYDYQLWALETLLLPERGPESDHLLLTSAYKQKLIDTFKSIITQNRETHVKQVQGGGMGAAIEPIEIEIYPLFPVEPFPTFYLRSARGYRFLSTYLKGVLPEGFMNQANRLNEDTSWSDLAMDLELRSITELLYGLYILSAKSVGLKPEVYLLEDELAEFDQEACIQRAERWLSGWRSDADLMKDPRVIVPVAVDFETGDTIFWAVLGVKAIKISAEFVESYEPEVVDPGSSCKVIGTAKHHYFLLVEHMEEVHINAKPPTRDELRAICDQYDTPEDIISALESLR